MDMKRFRKHISPSKPTDPGNDTVYRVGERRSGFNTMRLMGILAAFLMILTVLVTVSIIFRDPSSDRVRGFAEARTFAVKAEEGTGNLAKLKYGIWIFIYFWLILVGMADSS